MLVDLHCHSFNHYLPKVKSIVNTITKIFHSNIDHARASLQEDSHKESKYTHNEIPSNGNVRYRMNIINDFICGSICVRYRVNNFDQAFDFNGLYVCNYLFNDIYSICSGTYSERRFTFRSCKPYNDYSTKFENFFYGTYWTTDVTTVDGEFESAYNGVNDGTFELYSGNIDTTKFSDTDCGCTCDSNNYDKFRDEIGCWKRISS